jgi:dTDP-4-dehydrorhamnose reductase
MANSSGADTSLVVLGAGGLLGVELCERIPASRLVRALDRAECDIADRARVSSVLARTAPTVVINAAAYTDVDGAERNPDAAYAVNAVGAENVALAAAEVGALVVHFSTDFVFDGRADRAYDEFDTPSPLSVYGRSKLAGEELVRRAAPRHLVLRTGHLYGRAGKNFGSTLLRRLRSGEELRADDARTVAPTWGRSLAEQTLALLNEHAPAGTYHCMATGSCTWAEFARHMAKRAGLSTSVVASTMTGLAPRPVRSVLVSRLLPLRGLQRMPTWEEGLASYLAHAEAKG